MPGRPCQHGGVSQPDDIDKLLREIEAMKQRSGDTSQPALPAPSKATPPATRGGSGDGGSRAAWTGVGAVGGLIGGGFVGTVLAFLPAVSPMSTAVGAAIGGALVAFVSRPPRWFSRD